VNTIRRRVLGFVLLGEISLFGILLLCRPVSATTVHGDAFFQGLSLGMSKMEVVRTVGAPEQVKSDGRCFAYPRRGVSLFFNHQGAVSRIYLSPRFHGYIEAPNGSQLSFSTIGDFISSQEASDLTYTPSWWIQNAATVELEHAVPSDKLPLEYRGKDHLYKMHGFSGIIKYKKVQDDQGLAFYFDHQGRCYAVVIYPPAGDEQLPRQALSPLPAAPSERREAIHFDFDKFAIRPQDRAILDSHVSFLSQNKESTFLLEGHTDSIGTDSYNMRLSVQRSLSAYNYMVSRGADSARLRVSGRGETSPVANNKTPEGRALNRRVEFIVYP